MKNPFILILVALAVIAVGSFAYIAAPTPAPSEQTLPPVNPAVSTSSIQTSISINAPRTLNQPHVPQGEHAATASTTATLLQGMTMTFDDEFNTFSRYVDKKGNVTCNADGTGIWQTVYYFCSRTSAGNQEAEVYIDPGFLAYLKHEPAVENDPDNPFAVSNGVLTIRATPSTPLIHSAVGSWANYTSGMITTQFSFAQTYGYFEIRTKLPSGQGLWPAFWLLPTDKTWPPEIDVMEAFGDPSPSGEGGRTKIHYGSHALVNSENCGGWRDVGVDITQNFHTYGVDIEPTGITYYFDGQAYATCPANSATNKPFYMIANLAVGGIGSWPGIPNSSNVWPAYMYIDYIRAYQKK